MPLTCTLTGVDAWTSLAEVESLAREFPLAEWGFLYYAGRTEGRYSAYGTIGFQLGFLAGKARVALHICGHEALSQYLDGAGVAADLARMVDRVQINLRLTETNVGPLGDAIARSKIPVIVQYNQANAELWKKLPGSQLTLFDGSGGKGLLPEEWPAPISDQPFGYAGGLAPENIVAELPRMQKAAQGSTAWQWIDMEGQLRTADRFDLFRCRTVLEALDGCEKGKAA